MIALPSVLENAIGFTEEQFAELEGIHGEFQQNVKPLVEQKQAVAESLRAELEMNAPWPWWSEI